MKLFDFPSVAVFKGLAGMPSLVMFVVWPCPLDFMRPFPDNPYPPNLGCEICPQIWGVDYQTTFVLQYF